MFRFPPMSVHFGFKKRVMADFSLAWLILSTKYVHNILYVWKFTIKIYDKNYGRFFNIGGFSKKFDEKISVTSFHTRDKIICFPRYFLNEIRHVNRLKTVVMCSRCIYGAVRRTVCYIQWGYFNKIRNAGNWKKKKTFFILNAQTCNGIVSYRPILIYWLIFFYTH